MQYEFYGYIRDGGIILPGEQPMIRSRFLSSLKNDTQIFERIGKISNPKTNAQLKAFWGLFISYCLSEFRDRGYDTSYLFKIDTPTGIEIDGDLLKKYIYSVCPVFDEDGKKVGMSSMSIEQMCDFYDRCCKFVTIWGIYIPECNRNWKQGKNPDPFEKFRKE